MSNGRDVIDAIRAARHFTPASAGPQAVLYGWSQGGGAVIGAVGQGDYIEAREAVLPIRIVGAVAMVPEDVGIEFPDAITTNQQAVATLQALNEQMAGNVFNFTHLVMMYWGLAAAEPGLKLTELFTPEAVDSINGMMRRKCMHELSASFSYTFSDSYRSMLKPVPSNALAWIAAIKQLFPGLKPIAPAVIYWGNNDTVVPPRMHQRYFEAACQQGAVISREQLPGSNTHFSTPAASEPYSVRWVADRFSGKPVLNGCPR